MPLWRDFWIGGRAWPASFKGRELDRLQLWEGLAMEVIQYGGIFSLHDRFFGLKFCLPVTDPLYALAEQYAGSGFPGIGLERYATPLEEIVLLRDQLAELGLVLDPVLYPHSAEGFLPILAESAWRYVHRNKIPIFESPHTAHLRTVDPVALGLDEHWSTAAAYLEAAWRRLSGGDVSACPRWVGVVC